MDDGLGWQDDTLAVYRDGFSGILAKWNRLSDHEGEYWCDELREALLDLKLAVIEGDRAFAERAADEVVVLVQVLNERYPEVP